MYWQFRYTGVPDENEITLQTDGKLSAKNLFTRLHRDLPVIGITNFVLRLKINLLWLLTSPFCFVQSITTIRDIVINTTPVRGAKKKEVFRQSRNNACFCIPIVEYEFWFLWFFCVRNVFNAFSLSATTWNVRIRRICGWHYFVIRDFRNVNKKTRRIERDNGVWA